MKILLLTDNHTPSGGAENYFFELKNRLKKQDNIKVFSCGFGPKESQDEDSFVLKSVKSNAAKLLWRMLFHPMVYLKLRRYLKTVNPDVIHLHNVKQFSFTVLQAIKSYPVVQTMHDFSMICPTAQNIHQDKTPCSTGIRKACFWKHQVKFSRLTYLLLIPSFYLIRKKSREVIKKFIAPSPLLTEYLKKNGFSDTSYIPPFKPEPTPYTFDKVKPGRFLFAGNLGAHKGIDILLEEFALAKKQYPALTLYIAGTGPSEQHMQKRVRELGLQRNVFFLGWQREMATYYQECTATIFPSIGLESFGLIMTESMSHARPIIGVNRGTTAWLVEDNKTGLLFDPLKSGDLAQKIITLTENAELAQTLGKQGYQKLEQLIDNEKALEQIINIYKSARAN